MTQLRHILFYILLLPVFVTSPVWADSPGLSQPVVWSPGAQFANYLLPAFLNEKIENSAVRYMSGIQSNPGLYEFIPGFAPIGPAGILIPNNNSFATLNGDYNKLDLKTQRPRVLVVANRFEDHVENSVHLHETLKNLPPDKVDTFVLPVGAQEGLTHEQRLGFYRQIAKYFSMMIMLGGKDLDPENYNEPVNGAIDFNINLDRLNIELIQYVYKFSDKMIILGICRGSQEIAVAFGCKLRQHIVTDSEHPIVHETGTHSIGFVETPHNLLRSIIANKRNRKSIVKCNSSHHECVLVPPDHPILKPAAYAAVPGEKLDIIPNRGVIEGFEGIDGLRIILGIQSHPERTSLEKDPSGLGQRLWRHCIDDLMGAR